MVRNLDHLLLFNLSICFEKLSSSSESSLSLSRTRSSISSEDSDSFVSFLFLSILVLLADREAEGHNLFKRQSWHFGEGEEQICCPNPTSKRLILSQYFLIERTHQKKKKKTYFGNHDWSCNRVSSGFLLSVHWRRLQISWTWTSTPIPSHYSIQFVKKQGNTMFQAFFRAI